MTFTPLGTPAVSGAELGAGGVRKDQQIVPGTNIPLADFSLPQSVADRVGKAVMDRFSELMEGHTQHSRRKVLAGIVMTTDESMEDDMTVISVTTGTKCVNGEHISVNGYSLNGG